jgi:hypothetical protein
MSGTAPERESQPLALARVTLVLCTACLHGFGGECHTPGCAMWMSTAPDVEIVTKCEAFSILAEGDE